MRAAFALKALGCLASTRHLTLPKTGARLQESGLNYAHALEQFDSALPMRPDPCIRAIGDCAPKADPAPRGACAFKRSLGGQIPTGVW